MTCCAWLDKISLIYLRFYDDSFMTNYFTQRFTCCSVILKLDQEVWEPHECSVSNSKENKYHITQLDGAIQVGRHKNRLSLIINQLQHIHESLCGCQIVPGWLLFKLLHWIRLKPCKRNLKPNPLKYFFQIITYLFRFPSIDLIHVS